MVSKNGVKILCGGVVPRSVISCSKFLETRESAELVKNDSFNKTVLGE
jgi:hypothetical protein